MALLNVPLSSRCLNVLRLTVIAIAALAEPALAGPPYVTDDPEPTDYRHFEIYAFAGGTATRDGADGAGGIDFNYGGAPDLQLTAVLPYGFSHAKGGPAAAGFGNIELAAKYKFLHQEEFGWDIAFFPRVFLPSLSSGIGEQHTSLLLPLFAGKSWDKWSTFGGAGCTLNNGGGSKDFCQAGWALSYQVTPTLNLGGEIYHQGADTAGGQASTGIGAGAVYDLSDTYHLMASWGPGIENAAMTNRYTWYVALLFTR